MQQSYLTSRPRPIMPVGDPQHYQTYSIRRGSDVTVVAACQDVDCANWRNGWDVILDESTMKGRQLAGIARRSGRTFTETKNAAEMTVFRFDSRQRCFENHLTHPDIFTRTHGDFRQTFGSFRHTNARDWTEDFAENQQRLAEAQQKG